MDVGLDADDHSATNWIRMIPKHTLREWLLLQITDFCNGGKIRSSSSDRVTEFESSKNCVCLHGHFFVRHLESAPFWIRKKRQTLPAAMNRRGVFTQARNYFRGFWMAAMKTKCRHTPTSKNIGAYSERHIANTCSGPHSKQWRELDGGQGKNNKVRIEGDFTELLRTRRHLVSGKLIWRTN